jgi:hypothetical protein
MTGLLGFSSGYHAMMNCDALLMLGTDFPYQQFYPKNARIIQVDRRGEQKKRLKDAEFLPACRLVHFHFGADRIAITVAAFSPLLARTHRK